MVNVIYWGSDQETITRVQYIPGMPVQLAHSYKEAASLCKPQFKGDNYIVLYERHSLQEDITAISYIKKKLNNIYLIMITEPLSSGEITSYLRCGINDTINRNASLTEINNKISFIIEREEQLFANITAEKVLLQFRIPLWKRIFDIAFSLGAILALSPIFILTSLAIKMESKGPIWYKSKRVGANYKVFDFLKFRSMYTGADSKLKEFNNLNQYATDSPENKEAVPGEDEFGTYQNLAVDDNQPLLISDDFIISEKEFSKQKEEEIRNAFVKLENDPRITRVGRFIRKYSIDELPQLINILKGDMSVVGNRPLPLYEAEKLTIDDSIDRFIAPAGLTGLWQVEKRGDAGKLSAEERKQLDILYGQTYNFSLDCKILLKTITAFIQKENV